MRVSDAAMRRLTRNKIAALILIPIWAASWLQPCVAAAEESPDAIRTAIERGLRLVTRAGTNWPTHRECFSCHHQTLPMFAVVEAARVGFPTDAEWLNAQGDITHAHFRGKLDALNAGKHIGGAAFTVVYGLWALQLDQRPADETTSAMLAYLLKTQKPIRQSGTEGDAAAAHGRGWDASCRRPPLQISSIAATVLALDGMQAFGSAEQQAEIATARDEALVSLRGAPLVTQEDRVWQLWGCHYLGADATQIDSVCSVLLQSQNEDGGWSQEPGMPSDAYSTGQGLYVLRLTGRPVDDAAVQRATSYLLRTQRADGSWLVETRAKPVQTFFENGDPHGKHQFLSVAATAWGTAGLCRMLGE